MQALHRLARPSSNILYLPRISPSSLSTSALQLLRSTAPLLLHHSHSRTFCSSAPRTSRETPSIVNPANILTSFRLLCAPVCAHLILSSQPIPAGLTILLCGASDFLDGYLARHFHYATKIGSYLDPLADKALITCCVTSLTYVGCIPVYAAAVIIVRDALLLATSAMKLRGMHFESAKQIQPLMLSRLNTALQIALVLAAVGAMDNSPLATYLSQNTVCTLAGLTAATTAASGVAYARRAFMNRTVMARRKVP